MILKLPLTLLLAGVLATSFSYGQPMLELTKGWRFNPVDKATFANQAVNDKAWKGIDVGSPWEKQGLPDVNGVVWYRLRIVIPASLRKQAPLLRGLRLALGRIDDNDQTFVNGKEIGRTSGWDENREYIIPDDVVHWDAENVVAVRVEDIDGNGGLTVGPYQLGGAPKLTTLLSLKATDKPTSLTGVSQNTLTKSVHLLSKVPLQPLHGTINTTLTDAVTRAILFNKTEPITLNKQGEVTYSYSATLNGAGSYLATYALVIPSLSDTIRYSTLIGYRGQERTTDHLTAPVVVPLIPAKTRAFPLEHTQFSGFLQERLNANLTKRLLNIDEQGILEGFYNRPGTQIWVGEYPGKYLHAASRVWRYSKNAPLKAQMDRIVDILIGTQLANGYLGTYTPDRYWTSWDVWAHKYDLLGLLSYYEATGYAPALEASKRVGDLLLRTFGTGPGQLNIVETGDHVGMASASVLEPMTDLYRFTGEPKYLDFCRYIVAAYDTEKGPKIVSTLNAVGKVDKTANAKAYEMMSNLVGIVKLYQLTGIPGLLTAAETAWQDIATNKLYITGTASAHELFQPDGVLPMENKDSMGEGCVTTTWLQFSQALYALTGQPKYVDEIEKSIFNHLFAAENPQTGCVSYYTALMGKKPYRCTITGHCCLASIPRGFAVIPELVYTRNQDSGLNVNLYAAGSVRDSIRTGDGITIPFELTIASRFPAEGKATITLNPVQPAPFRLALHVPVWARNFRATVDGKMWEGIAGQYLNLDRMWTKNTVVAVSFDLNPQWLDGGQSYPGQVALKNGPQVLALDQALNPGLTDMQAVTVSLASPQPLSATVLPTGWVGSQLYSVPGQVAGKPVTLRLVPFAEAGQTGGEVTVWLKRQTP